MYCRNCGNEIKQNDEFCPLCGVKVLVGAEKIADSENSMKVLMTEEENASNHVSDSNYPNYGNMTYTENTGKKQEHFDKKSRKIKFFILITTIIVLLTGGALGAYFWYVSPKQSIFRALKEEDYEEVKEIIEENEELEKDSKVVDKAKQQIHTICDRYLKEEVDYSVAKSEVKSIRDIGIDSIYEDINFANEYLDKLNSSRICFGTAEEFMKKEEYPEAIIQYQGVIEEDPSYQKARDRIGEATEKYRTLHLRNAQTKADQDNYQGAIDILIMALDTLPNDTQLSQQLVLYQSELAKQKREEVISSADGFAQKRQYIDAIEILDQYISLNMSDAEMKEIRQQYYDAYVDEVLAQADNRVNAGDFQGALEEINKGLANARDERKLVEKKNEVSDKHIQKILGDAQIRISEGDYSQAIILLEDGTKQYGRDVRLTEKINEYKDQHIIVILNDVDNAVKAGDYLEALNRVKAGENLYAGEQRIKDKRTEIENNYVQNVIASADKALKDNGYEEAVSIIREATYILPTNQSLTQKMTEYEEYRPVDLFALDYFNADEKFEVYGPNEGRDNAGNTHRNMYRIYINEYNGSQTWVTYKLDGKYDVLQGTFFLSYDYRTTDRDCQFSVYGDDKLLFTGTVTGGELPIDFSIDIKGVQLLKITYKTHVYSGGTWSSLVAAGKFSNTILQRIP